MSPSVAAAAVDPDAAFGTPKAVFRALEVCHSTSFRSYRSHYVFVRGKMQTDLKLSDWDTMLMRSM